MKLLLNIIIRVFVFFQIVGFLLVFVVSSQGKYGTKCVKDFETPYEYAKINSDNRLQLIAMTAGFSMLYLGAQTALYLLEKRGKCY